ncbi:MAG: hypothetical protein MR487_12725 [Lachnospiraceae bacterium]|nr:hypothetical protein [Lachnospiraceae bacterium]
MGFFGSLFRAVGRGLGKVVEKAGDVINSDTLRSVGWDLQDRCAKDISNEKSYDKNTANIYSTERLNEILTSFSTGIYRHADSLILRSMRSYYPATLCHGGRKILCRERFFT